MTAELSYVPAAPAAGDSVHFTVTGEVPEASYIVATGADDGGVKKSTVFTQGLIPEGTGADVFTLEVVDATSGDFTLDIYDYGDGANASTTDPIYYFSDDEYTYPDSAELIGALEGALPGISVSVSRAGPVLTLVIGGAYGGRRFQMTGDATGLTGGSPAIDIVDVVRSSGPFAWGPVTFEADTWTVDVVTADDQTSVLAASEEIVVA